MLLLLWALGPPPIKAEIKTRRHVIDSARAHLLAAPTAVPRATRARKHKYAEALPGGEYAVRRPLRNGYHVTPRGAPRAGHVRMLQRLAVGREAPERH